MPEGKAKKSASETALFDKVLDAEAYNYVVRNSQLEAIQLIENELKVEPKFFVEKDDITLDLNHQVCTLSYVKKESVVLGTFHFEVIGKKGRKYLMKAKSDFLVVYKLGDEAVENEAKAFCARVGLFAAYPYFRSNFAHLSALANLELPILPVLSADPLQKLSGGQRAVLSDTNGN